MSYTVSAIIVNYNAGPLLRGCMGSLLACPLAVQIIVVDNASHDGSLDALPDSLASPSAASSTIPARRARRTSVVFECASFNNFSRCMSPSSIALAKRIAVSKVKPIVLGYDKLNLVLSNRKYYTSVGCR